MQKPPTMLRPTLLIALLLLLPTLDAHPRKWSCSSDSDCDAPLSCLGNPGNKKCLQKKPAGMPCGKDPFWVCQDHLICEDRQCRIPVEGSCNAANDVCADGLFCAGNKGKKRCIRGKGPNMRCGKDPFWRCQPGLECVDRVCRNIVKRAGSCRDPADLCEEGLSCVGPEGKESCFMKKGPGMRCGQDPYWVCEDGLTCASGKCAKPVGTGGKCDDANTVCKDGLSCLGKAGNKKCFRKKPAGMRCGVDPYWVCEDRLVCIDNICRKLVGKGKRCGRKRFCKDRFYCVGPINKPRCVVPGRLGKRCGEFETCRDSVCIDGKCVVEVF